MKWLALLKEYWQVWLIVVALATTITAYVGLPGQMKTLEAAQKEQEKRIIHVEKFTERLDGYLEGQQQMLQQQQRLNERLATQTASPPPTWRWMEQDADGEWCCTESVYEDCWTQQHWERCN